MFCKELFTISKQNPMTIEFFKSDLAIEEEKKRHLQFFPYTIHPLSKFCNYFNVYCLFIYVLQILYKTYSFAFVRVSTDDPLGQNRVAVLGLVLDVISIITMLFQCFIGYTDKKNIELSLQKIMLQNFISGHFFCDLFSSIPRVAMARASTVVLLLINTTVILKFRRITTIIYMIHPTFKCLKIHSQIKRFVFMFFLFHVIITHFMTCVLVGVARYRKQIYPFDRKATAGSFASEYFWNRTRTVQYMITFMKNSQYTLLVNNYRIRANTKKLMIYEEQAVRLFNYLVGKLLVCTIWIVMLYVFLSKRQLRTKFEEVMTELNQYMYSKQLPLELKRRLITYYKYKYQNMFLNERLMNSIMPEHLKKEIDVFLYKSLIQQVSIFSEVSGKHLKDIISSLKPRIYLPGDLIIQSGLFGDSMFFIESGTVSVFSPSGVEICHLYDGAYFGEVCVLFKHKKRTASIIAIEITRMYELEKKAFDRCFKKKDNRKAFKSIVDLSQKRQKQTQDIEFSVKQSNLANAH